MNRTLIGWAFGSLLLLPVCLGAQTSTPTPDCCTADKIYGSGTGSAALDDISAPLGLVAGSQRVYMADGTNHRVDVYDLAGNLAPESPIADPAWVSTNCLPQGLALDGQGHLYVVDFANKKVFKMDLSASPVTTLTTFDGSGGSGLAAGLMDGPIGIWADAQGATVVVAENLNGKRVRIYQEQAGGGYIPVQQLPVPSGAVSFKPVGVAEDAAGNLYVTDDAYDPSADLCVWKYQAPSYSSAVTVADNSGGHLWDPRFITLDGLGNFYVGNRGTIGPSSLSVFGPDWTFLYQCTGASGTPFVNAQGVGVDGAGRVYVTDEGNDRVVRFKPCSWTVPPAAPTATPTPAPPPCSGPMECYLYPDPAAGQEASLAAVLCQAGPVRVGLYNAAAEKIASLTFNGAAGKNVFQLSLAGFAHGVYYCVVSSGSQRSGKVKFAVVR